MAKTPDHLRFHGGCVDRIGGTLMVGWNGAWPPPERLGVAVGHESKYSTVFDPSDVDETHMVEIHEIADVSYYRRVSASSLPDDFESQHVFRGADYEVEL